MLQREHALSFVLGDVEDFHGLVLAHRDDEANATLVRVTLSLVEVAPLEVDDGGVVGTNAQDTLLGPRRPDEDLGVLLRRRCQELAFLVPFDALNASLVSLPLPLR